MEREREREREKVKENEREKITKPPSGDYGEPSIDLSHFCWLYFFERERERERERSQKHINSKRATT